MDVYATDYLGYNAALCAAQGGHLDALKLLKGWNVDLHLTLHDGGQSIVHMATEDGHLDVLRALGSWNVDLHATDNQGFSATHFAAAHKRLQVLHELKRLGVSLSPVASSGATPLDPETNLFMKCT